MFIFLFIFNYRHWTWFGLVLCHLIKFQKSSVSISAEGIVCSYAFALPVATAPNAIVFGHSSMKTSDMMKAGFLMNFVCVGIICICINTYAIPLFGLNNFPEWATKLLENTTMCDNKNIFWSEFKGNASVQVGYY